MVNGVWCMVWCGHSRGVMKYQRKHNVHKAVCTDGKGRKGNRQLQMRPFLPLSPLSSPFFVINCVCACVSVSIVLGVSVVLPR